MRAAALFLYLIVSGSALAAGGSSMGGGGMASPEPRLTPEEKAVKSYNSGIRQRDKAWQLEAKAEELESGKKRSKLEKKAGKAYRKAIKHYRAAIKHNPWLYQAHSSLGYALRKTGDFEAALAAYDEALSINASYTEAIEYRAQANLALGNFDETQSAYQRLMQLDHAKANELMSAIESWLESPPDTASTDQVENLKGWVIERNKLSLFLDKAASPGTGWAES